MTALKERAPATPRQGSAAKGSPVVPSVKQVNLLPPEVTAARSLQRVKVWLLLAVGLVLVALLALFAVVFLAGQAAQERLATAQDRTTALQREAAQYAEVPRVLNEISAVEEARELGMATEVRWKPYVDAFTAVLPSSVSLDSYTVLAPAPQDPLPMPADPLQSESVGSITFDGRSITVPDTAALMDALEAVPGFQDVWVTTVGRQADESGDVYYQVSGSIQLTDETFERRFADVVDEEE